MKQWLEIIHLRLTGDRPLDLVKEIQASSVEFKDKIDIHIYRHEAVGTDLCIHIHLRINEMNSQISEYGTRLSSALKEYGMVKHSKWIEEHLS